MVPTTQSIPIVDLNAPLPDLVESIDLAMTTVGFMMVKNALKFPPARNRKAMEMASALFNLSSSEKRSTLGPVEHSIRGYFGVGGENIEGLTSIKENTYQNKVIDSKEGWEVGRDNPPVSGLHADTVVGQLFCNPEMNRWPKAFSEEMRPSSPASSSTDASDYLYYYHEDLQLPLNRNTAGVSGTITAAEFRDFVNSYYEDIVDLSAQLIGLSELALQRYHKLSPGLVAHCNFDNMVSTLRMLHYPPSKGSQQCKLPTGETIGIGAHRDYGLLTLLLQDCSGGLQVLSPNGREWIEVPPNTEYDFFVVNVGDMMMQITNGLYKSNIHRVVRQATCERSRYSIPFFVEPDPRMDVPGTDGKDCEAFLIEYYKRSGILNDETVEHHRRALSYHS
ncbi:hypothetical protein FOL47_010900 [Perkinsus chesapeaki]|uniref:Fe2OG dioxygenase domain-containing protein n=1 Tax=Perkinsus chesapeaki TaxID=330153 RepID=A0A7J6L1M8_PERCH|nr:hypothetical protein FOL47_010900 [Perkinsus chesapeaki]